MESEYLFYWKIKRLEVSITSDKCHRKHKYHQEVWAWLLLLPVKHGVPLQYVNKVHNALLCLSPSYDTSPMKNMAECWLVISIYCTLCMGPHVTYFLAIPVMYHFPISFLPFNQPEGISVPFHISKISQSIGHITNWDESVFCIFKWYRWKCDW